MQGRKDEEAELRALGVMGPMGWHPDARHYDHKNFAHLDGSFEHCTCNEATMYRLISDRHGFVPGTFTGVYVETGEQLPRELQKFWGMIWHLGRYQ
jgi:hypothetical protein